MDAAKCNHDAMCAHASNPLRFLLCAFAQSKMRAHGLHDDVCVRTTDIIDGMKDPDETKDPVAQAMARKRWEKASKKERAEVGKMLSAARWAGHVAKRPASARKKKKGRP